MQRSLVEYHGTSHLSLVFFLVYTRALTGPLPYRPTLLVGAFMKPLGSTVSLDRMLIHNSLNQEPITRSVHLPHIPVTAFSRTDLVLG